MNNFRWLFSIGLGLVLTSFSCLAETSWETDYQKAQEQAKASHKLVLLDFTGSDWCGYCRLLNREILSKDSFKDYASKNLVLVEVDFPRSKEQSRSLRDQNRKLAMEHEVRGFPTIVVLDSEGRKVWQHNGYFPDGPEAFIAELEKLRKG